MIQNHLVLSGIVCKKLLYKVSPSGIPHCQFLLEHQSVQEEAGFYRKVWCKMPVIVSGYKNHDIVRNIKLGSRIIAHGFIGCHTIKNEINAMVLHAEKIELIDSGE